MEQTDVYLLVGKDMKSVYYSVVSVPVFKWLTGEESVPEHWLKMGIDDTIGEEYEEETGQNEFNQDFIDYFNEVAADADDEYSRMRLVQKNEFTKKSESFNGMMDVLSFMKKHNLNLVGEFEYICY